MQVLVLAPHTDDGEFGCGGTIARFVSEGHHVHYVAFSAAEKSVPGKFSPNVLRKEVVAATGILGIPKKHLQVLSFEVRKFPEHRQEILEILVELEARLIPDMVLLPSPADTHQDHQVIAAEGFRAFKMTTLLGYELPYNNLIFTTSAFVCLDEDHLKRKIEALQEYKSQAAKEYASRQSIESLARVRGVQVGTQYAEAFETIRWVMR